MKKGQQVGKPMSTLGRDLGAVVAAKAAVLSAIGPVHERTLDTMSMLKIADSFHLYE
ncbi:hypothetical protein Plhal304r1_c023g0080281 [Plasmopara halstedii]